MADGIDGGVAAQVGDAYYDTFVIIDLEATCDEDDNPKVRLVTCQGRTGLPLWSGVGARGFVATGRPFFRPRAVDVSIGGLDNPKPFAAPFQAVAATTMDPLPVAALNA